MISVDVAAACGGGVREGALHYGGLYEATRRARGFLQQSVRSPPRKAVAGFHTTTEENLWYVNYSHIYAPEMLS